jgi:hypothetical protein
MSKESGSGSGMNNLDHISVFWVKILKFFDADPGSMMEKIRIRDPGRKKFGSGIRDGKFRIRDKHPGIRNTAEEVLICSN